MTALLPTRWTFSLSMSLIHLQGDTEVHQVAREGEKNQDSEENETEVVKCPQAENPPRNFIFSSGTLCPFSIVPKIPFSGLMLPVADRMQRQFQKSFRVKLRKQNVKYICEKCTQDIWERQTQSKLSELSKLPLHFESLPNCATWCNRFNNLITKLINTYFQTLRINWYETRCVECL